MKIEFDGRIWDLDTAHISFRHALAVQKQTGLSVADWEDSLDFKKDDAGKIRNPPPEWLVSVGALYWLMLAQNGEIHDPDTMDFDFTGFLQAYFAALMAEVERLTAEAEVKPAVGPTSPSGDQPSSTLSSPMATIPTPPGPEGGATGF